MPHKFNIENIERLSDPKRLEILDLKKIVVYFGLKGEITLVDIGTGSGLFAEAFLKLLPEARCYTLDIKQEAIDWIKENTQSYKSGRLIPQLMAESKTQLWDNTADFVFMITLHHELEEPVKLLMECSRILKPKGKLLIADWLKEGGEGPPKHHRVDYSTAISHLKDAGFTCIEMFDASSRLFCISAVSQ
ncbi:methyltransferase domain-containing protein [Candidatus Poribacteria bacterium]|nr:methyltransferase domain-containing protein [Candidatus Poribacteria bacterium]